MRGFYGLSLSLVLGLAAGGAFAAEGDQVIKPEEVALGRPVDFEQDIFPALDANCIACHNLAIKENGLNLETVESLLKGGKRGPSVVAKDPDKSLLYQVVTRAKAPHMPPLPNKVQAAAFTPKEVGLLRQWIIEGASVGMGAGDVKINWQRLSSGLKAIYSVAISNDGQYVACGRANQIYVYHIPTGQLLTQLVDPLLTKELVDGQPLFGEKPAHRDFVHSLAFSPDGTLLASGDFRTIRLWKRPDNVVKYNLAAGAAVGAVAVSPDGKWLATGAADNSVKLWNLADGTAAKALAGHTGPITALVFTPDSTKLVTASKDQSFRLWTVADGAPAGRVDTPAPINTLILNPEATQAYTGGADNLIRVWTLPAGAAAPLAAVELTKIAVSVDRKWLAVAQTSGKIDLVDLTEKKVAKTLEGHAGALSAVQFSANGARLVSAGADKTVRLWDVAAGTVVAQIALPGEAATAATVAPNGDVVVIGDATGVIQGLKIEAAALVADAAKMFPKHEKAVSDLQYNRGGDAVFSASLDGNVRRYNAANGQQAFAQNHGAPVADLDLSNDQQWLATAGENKQVKLWNAGNGGGAPKPTYEGFTEAVKSVCLAGDGPAMKVVGGAANGQILIFNTTTGLAEQGAAEHAAAIQGLAAIGEKADQIASASADKTVKTWGLAAGIVMTGHGGPVNSLALVLPPNGQLLSGSEDGTLRVWTIANGQAARNFSHGAPVTAVAVRPDGTQFASSSSNNTAKLWNAGNNQQIAELKGDVRAQRFLAEKTADDAEAKANVAATMNAAKAAETDATAKAEAAKKAVEAKATADAAVPPVAAKQKEAQAKFDAAKAAADGKTDDAALQKAKADAEKVLTDANAELKKVTDAATAAAKAAELADKGVKEAQAKIVETKAASDAAVALAATRDTELKAAQAALAATDKPIRSVAFSPDGKVLATVSDDNLVHTYNTLDGSPLSILAGHQAPITTLVFGPNNLLITGSADQTAKVWDLNPAWELVATLGPKAETPGELKDSPIVSRVLCLDFSDDGKFLASGGGDPSRSGELMIWDVASKALVKNLAEAHSDTVFGVQFSRDGKYLVSGAADKFVKIFEIATGKHVKSFEGHTHHVLGVGWQGDGKVIASAGSDNVVKVWSVETGEQQRTIQGYNKQVTSLQFVGRSINFVTACGDAAVRLTRADNAQVLRNFAGATDYMYSAAATPDEKIIAAGGEDGVLRIWNGTNAQPLLTLEAPKTKEQIEAEAKAQAAAAAAAAETK